jgi:hypothetical protein
MSRFMDEYRPLHSEEDIRTKVVTAWLADHGFGPSDISVEYSFESLLSIEQIKTQSNNLAALLYQLPLPLDYLDIDVGRN